MGLAQQGIGQLFGGGGNSEADKQYKQQMKEYKAQKKAHKQAKKQEEQQKKQIIEADKKEKAKLASHEEASKARVSRLANFKIGSDVLADSSMSKADCRRSCETCTSCSCFSMGHHFRK